MHDNQNQNLTAAPINSGNGSGWILIVVMMIFFWPIGLILLLRKLATDRSATFKSGGAISKIGWALLIVGALVFLASFSSNEIGAPIMGALFIVGGIVCLQKAQTVKTTSKKYRLYISIIVNEGITRIDDIAKSAGVSFNEAEKTIQEMLDKGYFHGHINQAAKELILAEAHRDNPENLHFIVVRCDNCGADNKVPEGRVAKCEYCRSLIRT
jgi:predicted transcriptional regulator